MRQRSNSHQRLASAERALLVALRRLSALRSEPVPCLRALLAAKQECSAAEQAIEHAMVAVESEAESDATSDALDPPERYDAPR